MSILLQFTFEVKLQTFNPKPPKIDLPIINKTFARYWWLVGPGVALLAYLPTLTAYFTGEDFTFIYFAAQNKAFYQPSQHLFYRPVPNLFWWLDYNLWGLQAFGYHLTNLLLHAINVLLVGWLARQLNLSRPIATLTAVIFALHPIHVEPVVWLSSRPDLLATLFFLLALLCGLKYFEQKILAFYPLSLLAFTVGMFCKESAISLPLVLFGLGLIRARPNTLPAWFFFLLKFVPYALAVGLYLLTRFEALGSIGGYNNGGHDLLYIGWNATVGLWLPLLVPGLWLGIWLGWLLLVLYGFIGWRVRQKRLSWGVALVFMYGSFLPALDTAPVDTDLSQSRILYLPSVGFCLLLAQLILLAFPVHGSSNSTHRDFSQVQDDKAGEQFPQLNFKVVIVTLSLCYIFGLMLAILPWFQAGTMVNATLNTLKATNLPLKPGDSLYYEGLADDISGAYVWRNGMDGATRLFINPQVEGLHRTDDLILDYRKAERGTMWFIRYSSAVGSMQPEFYYSVATANQPLTNILQGWDFRNCQEGAGWHWEVGQGRLDCALGRGLVFNTQDQKTTMFMTSPPLRLEKNSLNFEFSNNISYDFSNPLVLGQIILKDNKGQAVFQANFDMAANGRSQRYRLIVPISSVGTYTVTLRATKLRNNVLWQEVGIGVGGWGLGVGGWGNLKSKIHQSRLDYNV